MSEVSNTPSVHFFQVIHPCPECGAKAGTTFSRDVCACSMMHLYCAACGVQADPCWDEVEQELEIHERVSACSHVWETIWKSIPAGRVVVGRFCRVCGLREGNV